MLKCLFIATWAWMSCALLFGCSFASANNSPGSHPEDVQSPMIYPAVCNRPRVARSALCDVDDVMSDTSRDIIEGMLNEIVEHGTGQAAVCLLYKMSPAYIKEQGSVEKAGERFARAVHDKWAVGDVQKQNGVVVFMSIHDRMVYISTGSGVEQYLSSHVIEGIISHMRPALVSRDYSRALQTAVTEVDLILQGKPVPLSSSRARSTSTSEDSPGEALSLIIFVFFVISAIVNIVAKCGSNTTQLHTGQRALDRLMREVQGGEDERFHSASCPICLEDFSQPPADGDAESGSASSTGTASQATERAEAVNASPLRPMMLPCDHQFCFGCLSEYLKTPEGTKCPICRAPVEPTAPVPRPQVPSPSPDNGAGAGTGAGAGGGAFSGSGSAGVGIGSGLRSMARSGIWQRRSPEINYRINRMRILYPDVLDANTANRLQSAATTGPAELAAAIQSRSTEVTTLIDNAQRRAAMRSSGSSGSRSRSFGGGRSSGGGGGRW